MYVCVCVCIYIYIYIYADNTIVDMCSRFDYISASSKVVINIFSTLCKEIDGEVSLDLKIKIRFFQILKEL
jgi:hypothetical protein